jgi:enoyl-CoA hydratase/carnithine racemase
MGAVTGSGAGVPAKGEVQAAVRDGTGWIVIAHAARRNALSRAMMIAMTGALRSLDADPQVAVIVIRGDGTDAFSAGADITEFATRRADGGQGRPDDAITTMFEALETLSTPLIAMISGYCLGAGMAIALGADLRIADVHSRFAIPAARLGIGYPLPQVRALTALVGPGAAAEILYTGRQYGAAEALRIGLVNRVVQAADLEAAVVELSAVIASNAPLSVRAAKASIKASIMSVPADAHSSAQVRAEDLIAACAASADTREGHRAFLDKRPPRFLGL